MKKQLITPTDIIMIRPHQFVSNPQTMQDNAFQVVACSKQISQQAYDEVSKAAAQLSAAGIQVSLFEDEGNSTPDSVFPNNWFSTHCSGELITYPMYVPNRRLELRQDIIAFIRERYQVSCYRDLSPLAEQGRFLEGTGSIVIDHAGATAYAVASKRTDKTLFTEWCQQLGYQAQLFDATDASGKAVYHTNVLMCVAERFVLIGLDMVPKNQQTALLASFEKQQKTVITLSSEQINHFCGNAIELKGKDGNLLALSSTAYQALTPAQIAVIRQSAQLLPIEVSTIETAGGSLRCMIAGIHLAQR